MSVLVFAESQNKKFKKAAFETVTYGAKTAALLGTDCIVLTLGEAEDAGQLGKYGASRVVQVTDGGLAQFDSQVYTKVIAEAARQLEASVIIMAHSSTGKSLMGRLAAHFNAGSVAGANSLPTKEGDALQVQKGVFSGKAFATYAITSPMKLISVMGNSLQPEELGAATEPEVLNIDVPASKVRVKEVQRREGIVSLPEAELVVSAGRGMKGPENWGMVEELADVLGATTACSRPVADSDWRPHHEHVGQTGVAIRPNLYIAIGISGAIQHLAGVNSSKVIVVINKDPEAPFFKAADYGVVADLFEVVPRLTEAVKKFKAS